MPTIKLSDGAAIDIDVTLSKTNAMARYGAKLPALVLDVAGLAAGWGSSLADPGLNQAALGASFKSPIKLGDDSQLIFGGSLGVEFQVYKPGKAPKELPEELGLKTPKDAVWVRLTFEAGISPAFESKHNDLSMGFKAGSVIAISNFRRFTASSDKSVGSCFQELGREFLLAGDLRDLEALPDDGTAAICVSGTGSLSFSGKFPIQSSVNTLASTKLPLRMGTLGLQAGFSAGVSASFSAKGGLTVAVTRDAGVVRLASLKDDQIEESLQISASAGIKASLGEVDLLSKLAGLISSDPEADAAELAAAGLPKETVQQIKEALEFAVDRSLTAAVAVALGAGSGSKQLFTFELNLSTLSATEKDAVHFALDGDVSSLLAIPAGGGVALTHSALGSLRSNGVSLRFNLLGVLNTFSVSRLLIEGSVLVEPETGDIVICDKVTASQIRGSLLPFAADAHKVRRLQNSTFVLSASLLALQGHVQPGLKLTASVDYFELHSRTCRQSMKDNLDAVVALDLISAPEASKLLGQSVDEFGRSMMLLSLGMDPEQCSGLFLDEAGTPFPDTHYEAAGCEALRQLVQPGDPDEFRLTLVANWQQARSLGNPNSITQAAWGAWFPKSPDGFRQARLAAVDYQLISWWATAMASAADSLAAFLSFLETNSGISWQDNGFKKAFAAFSKALAAAARKSKPDLFDNPWGLVAINVAVQHLLGVRKTARILSERLALDLP
jgi:hypothetical protein